MKTTWDLTPLYENEAAFEGDLAKFKDFYTPKMASYEGKLKDEGELLEYFKTDREVSALLQKLYMYAGSLSDLDKKDVEASEREGKVRLALERYLSAVSYAEPEMLALGEKHFVSFFEKHPEINEYDFQMEKLFLAQKHVLSADKERLLSHYAPLLGEGAELYSTLSVADLLPGKCTLSEGKEVIVTQSNWSSLVRNAANAEDRRLVFETLYRYYDRHKCTYAEIYNNVLRGELAEMKGRGYPSILETHLEGNKIPKEVFLNLIDAAKKGSAPLKRYYELRRKALRLEKHHSYDRFLELAHSDKRYSFEEAQSLFFDSIKHFPDDFQAKAKEVNKEGYIDVYPKDGKRSGAYSNGGANIHPYILLNFEGELDDVFTLAHESGHSIHTLYSEESQPLAKQNYTIFVAEIASTFNEHNLLDYLLTRGDLDKNDKIHLLQKAIDEICSTFYRQTLFAEYEYLISLAAEKGEPISHSLLSQTMTDLYHEYYGIDIAEEKLKPLVWAYIPHLFYTPFYVYQYATSFTASLLIYERVKEKKEHAFEDYISLLKMGGSDFPIEEVKKAHVDFLDEKTFEACPKRMEELLDKLEALLNE